MKKVSVTLKIKELIYDIQNTTDITARSRHTDENGGNDELVAHMIVNGDDYATNFIIRNITDADSSLRNKLAEYLVNGQSETSTVNDTLPSAETDLLYDLTLPGNYNNSVDGAVAGAMHDYILNYTIAKWFSSTAPNEAKVYFDLADVSIMRVRQIINKRIRPVRPN